MAETEAPVLRDLLLAAFLQSPKNMLVRRDGTEIWLRNAQGMLIAIMTAEPSAAELRAHLGGIIAGHKKGLLHVVVIGGGVEATGVIKTQKVRRGHGVYQLNLDGTAQVVAGEQSPTVDLAVARIGRVAPLTEEQLAAFDARAADEARLAAALRGRFPWVTLAIGVTCTALFILGEVWKSGSADWIFVSMGANNGMSVKHGEVWRLLSSAFLHANLQHLAFNMLALAGFGPLLERLLGAPRYLALYGLSALGGGLASAFLRAPGFSVGASGAIWGLMLAGVALALRPRDLLPPHTLATARKQAIVPLVVNLAYSFTPGIDIHAHLGGGFVGALLVLSGAITRGVPPLWAAAQTRKESRSRGWTIAGAVLALAMAASVGAALATGKPWSLSAPVALRPMALGDTGLRLGIPEIIAGELRVEEHDGLKVIDAGNFAQLPLAVEVITKVLPAGQIPSSLEADRHDAETTKEDGHKLRGSARIVTIGGHDFVAVTHDVYDSLTRHMWVGYFGPRVVLVRVYTPRTPPAAWKGVEDRIIASLEAAP